MTNGFVEIFLDLLKSQGVEYTFCSPGTEWVKDNNNRCTFEIAQKRPAEINNG